MEKRDIASLIDRLARRLLAAKLTLATAESCTGGLVGHLLTNRPGSSDWYLGGVVAYANSAKTALLGVPQATLQTHGAVSEATVLAMARGARRAFGASSAVAISGIAGPTGGTPEKPVGTVYMAYEIPGAALAERRLFAGGRESVKVQSAEAALAGLLALLERSDAGL